jgi:hypothetical protein
VLFVSPMNDSVLNRICQIKVNYRVKAPLLAFTITDGTPITIPTGAQVEWRPPDLDVPEDELTKVRWLRDDYLVSDDELYQYCERVGANSRRYAPAADGLLYTREVCSIQPVPKTQNLA